MQQPALHLTAPKRIQATSIAAYRAIAPSLAKREAEAVDLIRRYPQRTARELMALAEIHDPNVLRPRMTALETRGVITKGEPRTCQITGKTVLTWRLA